MSGSDANSDDESLVEKWNKKVISAVGEEAAKEGFFSSLDKKISAHLSERERQAHISSYDVPGLDEVREARTRYYQTDRSETSWRRRLEYMWSPDEYGYLSPELEMVWQGTVLSFLAAGCYGAWQESAKIYRIFIEQNKYTMFQHPREAQRALQDRIVLAMMQGGWRSGWRLGLLTFTMTSVCQSLTVMRNSVNPLDYAVGGAVTGAVYRFNMGPRGMIGAGTLGSMLGLATGVTVFGLQLVSGETVQERWRREFQRTENKKRIQEAAAAKKDVRGEFRYDESQARPVKQFTQPQEDNRLHADEYSWLRSSTVKLTEMFTKIGLLSPPANDSFKIDTSDSEDQER